ncbi:MAG: Uma2 family endonuclease [Acidobacteria bacterium]|nr:Uma2 family endonuclease [Acidobacteriota bacterium]
MISVEEYLRTSFPDGDREYIDGVIVERNIGEMDHSSALGELIIFFAAYEAARPIFAFPSLRVQVAPARVRVPDVSVYVGSEPEEQVPRTPPFLVIEILSKDDRASDLQEKIDDYLAFGVRFVWVIDPRTRRGYIHTAGGSREAKDGILRTTDPDIELQLRQLF